MPRFVREAMTTDPSTLEQDANAAQAATLMRDKDIGAIVITDSGEVCGILTDRDIVVRGIAESRSPEELRVGDICTRDLTALSPDDSLDEAVRAIRGHHIRRLPVVDGGRAVGILSIGDLAIERDQESALAEISAAPPNN